MSPAVQVGLALPVAWGLLPEPMTAVRMGLRDKALAEPALALRLGERMYYPSRLGKNGPQAELPSIAFSDTYTEEYTCQGPTPVLVDAVVTADIAARTTEEVAVLAQALRRAWHQQPIPVLGNVARVDYLRLANSGALDAGDEGEVARLLLSFRMKAYLYL